MRQLLRIVGAGSLLFIVAAGVQEWSYFAAAWFGGPPAAPALSESEREAAAAAVRETVALTRHLYASGGDPRFAERMPAGEGVIREALAEIDYLERNRRRQGLVLHRLEIQALEVRDRDHVEIRTREYWTVRTFWIDSGGEADPPQATVLHCRYFVTREAGSWRVDGWETTPPLPEDGAG